MAKHAKRPGRPKVYDQPRKHLGIRPPAEVAEALEAYCNAQPIKPSHSAVTLHALIAFLKAEGYLK